MLKDKKIILGVTGSIAAYKSVVVARLLLKAGAEVQVLLTPDAASFVSPLTFATLTQKPVPVNLFQEDTWANHVALGRWGDLMLIAPATCNTLAKMAAGLCDNLLMATYLSATCPIMIAPAMDEDMWIHPATQRNVATLKGFGHKMLDVQEGELASGLVGAGRMAEPEDIVGQIRDFFETDLFLKGKKVLITAGPTVEALDPVRFISNHSSGKMGIALADEFQKAGGMVTLVLGPVAIAPPPGVEVVPVNSASQMYDAVMASMNEADIIVMAAAVADFTPETVETQKIKKKPDRLEVLLKPTKDILKEAGRRKAKHQLLVGFALETENEHENALKKLRSKNADLIVLNSLKDAGAGFGGDDNKVTIFEKSGRANFFDLKTKQKTAKDIVKFISAYNHE